MSGSEKPIFKHTASELLKLYRQKKISVVEVAKSFIDRIKAVEPKVRAFSYFDSNEVIRRAQRIQETKKEDSPLYGIPIVIKDNICVKGEETTCSSKILANFKPPYDATVIDKLREAGALLLGKANMDEFAFGSSCETSCYGPTKNPWDLNRIPGGSSGGSVAAVSADETVLALGSDTGGSIRQPAALCGVVGLKPTYGRVSRYGLIAFASSLDQIGPITKDVTDAAILMNVIAGYDEKDSTCANEKLSDYTKNLKDNIAGFTIGVPKEYFVEGLDCEVEDLVKKAIVVLKESGAKIKEVSLPHTEYAISVYYILATAEASSNLARFDGVQYGLRAKPVKSTLDMYMNSRGSGFGEEAKRRIILGTYVLSRGYYEAYYLKAQKVRTLVKQDFDEAFKACNCIVTPTSPTAAFKLGERLDNPLSMYLSDIFTISANLAGIPAISIPCGFTKEALPVGLQILARPFAEEKIFQVASAYEKNTQWNNRRPQI